MTESTSKKKKQNRCDDRKSENCKNRKFEMRHYQFSDTNGQVKYSLLSKSVLAGQCFVK